MNKICLDECLTDYSQVMNSVAWTRVRPKFGCGFGYGAETDLTCSFGLVSATAEKNQHKFGFGRNFTTKRPKRRNYRTSY